MQGIDKGRPEGEVTGQGRVVGSEEVVIGGPGHEDLGTGPFEQTPQIQGHSKIHFGFGQASGADGSLEKTAVAGVQDDPAAPQGRHIASLELFLEGFISRDFNLRGLRGRACASGDQQAGGQDENQGKIWFQAWHPGWGGIEGPLCPDPVIPLA